MGGSVGKLLEILKLGSAVPLPERMDVVYVADDLAGGCSKFRRVQPSQEVGPLQATMNVGHAGLDVLAELEGPAILGDLHSPHFASPGVDILEEVFVHGAQVRQIEIAERSALGYPLDDQFTLNQLEAGAIEEVQAVSENGRS